MLNASNCGKHRLFSEKTPENVHYFPVIQQLFPNAKFLFILRDPRAIFKSFQNVAKRARASGRTENRGNVTEDLKRIESAIKAGSSFQATNPEHCMTVYYEDLVSAPETTAKQICEFINLEFVPEMLQTQISTASSDLIRAHGGVWYTSEMYDRPISTESLRS